MYIYYFLLLHLAVDGHLGCFRGSALVPSAAVDTGVQVPSPSQCFWGVRRAEPRGHRVAVLYFCRTAALVSAAPFPWYSPLSRAQGLHFLHILGNSCYFLVFLNILFIFRETGREGEREGEKHQCVVAPLTPPTGDPAHNPGTCPDWESNCDPLVRRPALNPLSYTSQGCFLGF